MCRHTQSDSSFCFHWWCVLECAPAGGGMTAQRNYLHHYRLKVRRRYRDGRKFAAGGSCSMKYLDGRAHWGGLVRKLHGEFCFSPHQKDTNRHEQSQTLQHELHRPDRAGRRALDGQQGAQRGKEREKRRRRKRKNVVAGCRLPMPTF